MSVQRFSEHKIATAFWVIMLKWYADTKLQVKEKIEHDLKAAYLRLYHKLINNLNKDAKQWIDFVINSLY